MKIEVIKYKTLDQLNHAGEACLVYTAIVFVYNSNNGQLKDNKQRKEYGKAQKVKQ